MLTAIIIITCLSIIMTYLVYDKLCLLTDSIRSLKGELNSSSHYHHERMKNMLDRVSECYHSLNKILDHEIRLKNCDVRSNQQHDEMNDLRCEIHDLNVILNKYDEICKQNNILVIKE